VARAPPSEAPPPEPARPADARQGCNISLKHLPIYLRARGPGGLRAGDGQAAKGPENSSLRNDLARWMEAQGPSIVAKKIRLLI